MAALSGVPDLSKQPTPSSDSSSDEKLSEIVEKGLESEREGSVDSVDDFPLRWKIVTLCLALCLSLGSSFSENTLGPLKSTFKSELNIDNAKYGAISSATSLVNTILPIIGGYVLDYYGVAWGTMLCSTFIFIGSVVSAMGSNFNSFNLVIGGRIILGLGSTVIESAGSKILAHWFQHRGLAFVYGLDISWGKCVVLLAKATAVPMRDATDFWGWALWIPAIICFVNLLQNAVYVWWSVYYLPAWTRIPTGKDRARTGQNKRRALPDPKALQRVPRLFWFIVCTQILQAGVVGGFNGLSADIITTTRGSTAQVAGYTSALQQVIPIFLAPSLGAFFDKFGHRMVFVSFTSCIWILVYSLIAFSNVHALGVMIIASVAQSFNAMPFTCSIPLLVPDQTNIGLVFGVWKAFNNAGSVIIDIVAGRLQDITPDGGYSKVMAFFITMKAMEVCWGAFYGLLDRKYLGGVLTMSEHQRHIVEKTVDLKEVPGRRPYPFATWFGLGLLFSAGVTAWVLYIKYSI